MANIAPPRPPARARGRSTSRSGRPVRKSAAAPSSAWSLPSDVVVAVEDRGHVWSRSIHFCTVTGSQASSAASRSSRSSLTASSVRVSGRRKRSCDGVVEEGDERPVVAGDVEQPERLGWMPSCAQV